MLEAFTLLFLKINVFLKKRRFVSDLVNTVVIRSLFLNSFKISKRYKDLFKIQRPFQEAIIFEILFFILMNNKNYKRIYQMLLHAFEATFANGLQNRCS